MGGLSWFHWMIVLVVVLLLFGGRGKITQIMGDFAKGINAFKKGLKEDDKKSMEQARQVLLLLRTQTQELQEYWKTNEKERATRFHKAREEAWKNIKTLLNLKE